MAAPIESSGSARSGLDAANFRAPIRTPVVDTQSSGMAAPTSLAEGFFNRPASMVNTSALVESPSVTIRSSGQSLAAEFFGSANVPVNTETTNPFDSLPDGFKWGQEFGLDRMPLADIVPVVRSNIDQSRLATQFHENNHVEYAVVIKGIVPEGMSCVPSGGGVLGWTIVPRWISNDTKAAIAAAGDKATPLGAASGSGGDKAMIYAIARSKGKDPQAYFKSAKQEAETLVIPDDYNQILAEIGAKLGTVVGSENILEVRKRAAFEVAWQRSNLDLAKYLQLAGGQAEFEVQPNETKLEDLIPETGQYTIIEDFGPVERTTYIADRTIVREEVKCNSCGGINGHAPQCEVGQQWGIFNDFLRRHPLQLQRELVQPPKR